ncbi:hypothetical protein IL306_011889 [Fusarium sp. DS 682]|nr:hypothetical protein IL306_011889 [Fusarium sp. DS 682]
MHSVHPETTRQLVAAEIQTPYARNTKFYTIYSSAYSTLLSFVGLSIPLCSKALTSPWKQLGLTTSLASLTLAVNTPILPNPPYNTCHSEEDLAFLSERQVSPEIFDLTAEEGTAGCCIVNDHVDLTMTPGAGEHLAPNCGKRCLPTTRLQDDNIIQAGSFLQVEPFHVANCFAEFILVRALSRCETINNVKIYGTPFLAAYSDLAMLDLVAGEVYMLVKQDSEGKLQDFTITGLSIAKQVHMLTMTNATHTGLDRINPEEHIHYPRDLTCR